MLNLSGKANKESRKFWGKGELKPDDEDDYGGGGDVFLIITGKKMHSCSRKFIHIHAPNFGMVPYLQEKALPKQLSHFFIIFQK